MKKYLGKGVYGAVSIGKISVFKKCDAAVTRIHVEDTEKEKQRVKAAKELAAKQLTEIHEKALREVGETHAQIFEIHLMMLDDDDYNESIENIIDTQSVNAEYAVALTSDNFAGMFSSMDDAYMQARAADVRDISNRIIANLTGADTDSTTADEKSIVCADDLAPSETVSLDKDKVLDKEYNHLVLLCKNEKGYKNLIKMVSKSYTEGFYFKPRIDHDLLEKYSEGLVCLSACLAGEILQKFINYGVRITIYGDYSKYTSNALKDFIYESNKGKDVFFVSTEDEAIEKLTN